MDAVGSLPPDEEGCGIELPNVYYSKVNNDPYQWASTFDQYSFVNFVFGKVVKVQSPAELADFAKAFSLNQNSPNPFNSGTRIGYTVPQAAFLRLTVYNVLGQKVRTLVDGYVERGVYTVFWDGRDDAGVAVPSGVYIYALRCPGGNTIVRKMVLVR
ncbi:MAG: FlgD immunoglobulin-like domain containing protein [Bacteroidota bacterium]